MQPYAYVKMPYSNWSTYILFLLVWLIQSYDASGQKKVKSSADFYLEYSTFSKTVIIRAKELTYQEWIDTYDNPISSIPSSRKEVIKKRTLTSAEYQLLIKQLKQSSFLELPKNEYGELQENRNYPTSIEVKFSSKQKKVIYRSSPALSVEKAPDSFDQLEKMVVGFLENFE